MVMRSGPSGGRVESIAAPTASSTIDATARTGSPESNEPTKIGTPIRVPNSTTRTRLRRSGATPTIAAGSTPNASARPLDTSNGVAATAGIANTTPTSAGGQLQASPG